MSTLVERMKAKLAALNDAASKPKFDSSQPSIMWKPVETVDAKGKITVSEYTLRILPNPQDATDPFQIVQFYYPPIGNSVLAPSQFGRYDPCVEAYNETAPTEKLPLDEWKAQANFRSKLKPSTRYYALILIRGLEHEGPKYWGFTEKVWKDELLPIFADDDYGDITDLENGTDVLLTFTPKELTGTTFPSTKISPRRKSSVATSDPELLEKIKNTPAVTTFFREPSADELQAAVDKYLNPNRSEPDTAHSDANVGRNPKPPIQNRETTSQEASELPSTLGIADELDKFFDDLPFD